MNNAFDAWWTLQVSAARIKKWWKILKCRPWKAWFWCPLSSENAVATFPHLLEMSSTWYPNGLQISVRWCSETRKLVKMRLKSITKKRHEKNSKICAKIVQKKGIQKVIVLWFFRVPSQHGLYGVPGEALGPKSTSKRRPGHGFSVTLGPCFHFLWRHFGIFPVFHEQQIDSSRC